MCLHYKLIKLQSLVLPLTKVVEIPLFIDFVYTFALNLAYNFFKYTHSHTLIWNLFVEISHILRYSLKFLSIYQPTTMFCHIFQTTNGIFNFNSNAQ